MSNSILITGGLGYVGGRMAAYLSQARPNTRIVLATRENSRKTPTWAAGMELIKIDLKDKKSLMSSLNRIDTVVHLAALNETDSQADPQKAIDVNVSGVYNLLEASKEVGVERFVYFSTFHVYSKNVNEQITEQTPTRPIHPYALTHLAAEGFVDFYRVRHGLKTAILRLSNGYGYPMDPCVDRWTLVFNELCLQAVQEGRIRLRTSGRQHRDFISLTDVARAVEHLLFITPDAWGDGLFNLGGRCSMSILDVANRVASVYAEVTKRKISSIETERDFGNGLEKPIHYSINKLLSTGFLLSGDMDKEIEMTLKVAERRLHV